MECSRPPGPGHFWIDGNFVTNAICLDEEIEVDLPKNVQAKISSRGVTPDIRETSTRKILTLRHQNLVRKEDDNDGAWEKGVGKGEPPIIQISSFQSWDEVGKWFGGLEAAPTKVTAAVQAKADELTRGKTSESEKIRALYEFVALNFRYIGISLGQGRYVPHRAEEVLANRYGDCKDKHTLFQSLLAAEGIKAFPALISSGSTIDAEIPTPSLFDHVITVIPQGGSFQFVDTTPEVGLFGYLLSTLRNKTALVVAEGASSRLVKTPADPPVGNSENFRMDASLDASGTLEGKARIEAQGDSEILLRSAFRANSESRWNELVQGISAGMGFAGTVSDVSAAPAQKSSEAFWFAYSYHREDFSDWKERRIALALPPVLLPAIAEKRKSSPDPFTLGSPVEVTYEGRIKLPKGMGATLPPDVNLNRDFASYTAHYTFENGVLGGVRHLKRLASELPGSRRAAYSEFVTAMLEDQGRYVEITGGSSDAAIPGAIGRSRAGMPGAGGHSNNEEAQKLYDQGYESLQLGAPRAAISALEKVVKLDTSWSDGWLLLGNARMTASEYDLGIEAYQRALSRDPLSLQGHRVLPRALAAAHRNGEAIAAWYELLELSPNEPGALEILTPLLLTERRYSEAVGRLESVDDVKTESVEVQLMFGEAFLGMANEEKAMTHFRKALEVDKSANTLNSVAYALAESKLGLQQALQYAEEAVRNSEEQTAKSEALDTSNFSLMANLALQWDTLGWVRFRLGDTGEAVRYLEAAWSLMQTPVGGIHLGEAYEKAGRKPQAAQTYSMALGTLGSHGDPMLRQTINARLKALATAGVKTNKDAGMELSALRTYRVPIPQGWSGGYKTAQFGIAITKARPQALVWHLNGAEELKEEVKDLSNIKFRIVFPDDGPTKVIQRGILSCSQASRACTLVLMPIR
jgi:tetratricopeptide (TPR) repeat protein